ncbi:unnamed protein product [Trifolium pratense]|uniref:Uncharacterized protein n=1 Tax=Trifolium pratense TaxID=57577 RepID=A0ACB0J993_TRIPR|nr:unnamed protein product [Trifolium pratense]
MIEVANQFPLLEELDILYSENLSMNFLEVIGKSCPLLKSLIFSRNYYRTCDDEAIAVGKTMTELRHLKIHGNVLTDEGLVAILDGCPLLESLELQKFHRFEFTDNLKKRCHDQIKFLCLPNVKASSYNDDYDCWKNFYGENSNDDTSSEYCCDYEDDDF